MKEKIAEILQKALNRYLALDPESSSRLHRLRGKVVTLELFNTGFICQLIFDHHIQIKCDAFSQADTTIKGTPLTLLRMSLTTGDRKHFFSDDVSIEGDLDVGQEVIDLFDHLEIDWEEYLSHWIGDVPAHQVGRFMRQLKKAMDHARETLLQNINEYVHEENELFPPSEALQDFFNDVDTLRMDLDRVEAKIEAIKNKLNRGLE